MITIPTTKPITIHKARKPRANPRECKLQDLPAIAADLLGWRAVTNGLQPMHYVDATGVFVCYIGDWQPHRDLNQAALIRQECIRKYLDEEFVNILARLCETNTFLRCADQEQHLMIGALALDAGAEEITKAGCISLYDSAVWEHTI